MNKVVLIDDEPWILTGLEELLNWEAAGFKIVAKFTDPQVALEQIHKIKQMWFLPIYECQKCLAFNLFLP